MATRKQFLTEPYGGYHAEPTPPETADLTHVEKGSRAGELLRRYWQPVCLSEEVEKLPKRERIFGEDIVVFRTTDDEVAILDIHCPHRGTSLEFGMCEKTGLRCCYHGWLIGPDGTILETPGDPPGSKLKDRLKHAAYPAMEYKGLIFGYFGPPEEKPEFPVYDTYDYPGDSLRPYSLHYPCNWLQVHENVMDPAHAVFLHTRISYSHFADAWGELPIMDFVDTPAGMIYVTTRRWNDNVWIRSNDILLPNLAQVGHIWEDGQKELKEFARAGITRWTSPVEKQNCQIIGWRHFHPEVNPLGIGDPDMCGVEAVDFVGQDGKRSYEDRQNVPGDFDAQVSQRPIAVHALEHLTQSDKGVVMLRRMIGREIKKLESGEPVLRLPFSTDRPIDSYCHDTVLHIPEDPTRDDDELLEQLGKDITRIIVDTQAETAEARMATVRSKIKNYVSELNKSAAE